MTPSFDRGALLLRDEEGTVLRLSWEEEAGADADRRRALPAGDYKLISYRILLQDGEETWHLSATHSKIQEVTIQPGEDLRIEVDPRIHITGRIGHGRVSIAVQGEHKAGLSIYKDGRRIPMGYRIVGADEKELASGDYRYG